MRNSFSEFELGEIKTWADAKGAKMLVRADKKLVHVVCDDAIIMYQHYGKEKIFLVNGRYLSEGDLIHEMKQIGEGLSIILSGLGEILGNALQNIIDDLDGSDS